MISQKTIKKYKLDSASLKTLFTSDKPKKGVKSLIQLLRDRQFEGRNRNLSDYRIWAAVDLAYDASFHQTTPTILRHILSGNGTEVETIQALKDWGLNPECLFCVTNPSPGVKKYEPNYPHFFNVTIPLVRAYLTIRLANIYNQRNLVPLFQYQPSKYSDSNRVRCEILTDLVEGMSTNFGYSATLREFIFNALMYSVAIKFPVESWMKVEREDEGGQIVTEKEGVRYVVPHVTRVYYDFDYPLHTLNTDTGCSFAGYWTVMSWGAAKTNPYFWNTENDSVPYGENWLSPEKSFSNYWKEIYPCTLEFPKIRKGQKETDREKMKDCYSRNDYDKAFFVGYQFMRLNPSDWDISEYKYPVWMKFTIGADDTILFAETFSYRPCDYIGYDADSGRGRNVSLAQEIQPSQDMASNILTQHLLTIKRNLANMIFYDEDVVDADQIKSLNRHSQSQYVQMNFLGFSGMKMERQRSSMDSVFKSFTFPNGNTSELLTSLSTVVSMLERTLVMSAQEIGSAASHQQGNKEIEIINSSTTNRVAFTGSFVDQAIDAWKRQLFEALLCHGDSDLEATIPTDIPDLETHLTEIGFKFKGDKKPEPGQKKVTVVGKKDKLTMIQFVSRRADSQRQNDTATAQAMMLAINNIANNQLLSGKVDPVSLIELMEQAAKLAGADDDFKIRINQDGVLSGQLQETIQKIQQFVMQQVEKEVVEPTAKSLAEESNKVAELQQNIEALMGVVEQLKSVIAPPTTPIPPPAPAALPPQQVQSQPLNEPPPIQSAVAPPAATSPPP